MPNRPLENGDKLPLVISPLDYLSQKKVGGIIEIHI